MAKQEIELTIADASKQLRVLDERLRLDLQAMGQETTKGKKYPLHLIFRALHNDGKAARVRKNQAEADLLEVKRQRIMRDLLPRAEVSQFISDSFAPVREQVIAMPSVLASKVNPTDPEHARQHLEAWRDLFLRQCKEKLP